MSFAIVGAGCSGSGVEPTRAANGGAEAFAGNDSGATNMAGLASGGFASAGGASGLAGNGGAAADGTSTAGGSGEAGQPAMAGAAGAGAGTELSDGPLLAFPSAQGFGKDATGGRDGSVYHVTNLNDSGAGSFRDAVSSPGRVVVFDVSGYITLKTAVSAKSNLTIAGQTAPGGGIGFRGGEISFANSSNIICRYLRIRPGSETASDEDDALSLFRAKNVMIDHCSFEFGPWNNIDAVSDDWQSHPVTNISVQDSLIADPTGQQFGAHMESVASQMAWYRNIFASSHNRNPLAKADTVFVNNLLYNYAAGYTTHTSTTFKHDIVNNYFVFGPASTGTDNTWFQVDKNQSIFAAGNLKDTNLNGLLDGAATTPYWYQGTGTVLPNAWSPEASATKPLDAASAARVAISLAGPLPRDAIDTLIISQIMTLGKGATGTGANTAGPGGALYTSQMQTGLDNDGYGSIAAGTKLADADNDGVPDVWETATGSDPQVDDALKKAASGYTFIERYLNWLAAPHATSSGAAIDIDLAAYATGFSNAAPKYAVSNAQNGSVSLAADQRSAHFTPSAGFRGLAAFDFTVTSADGAAYTSRVLVLVSAGQ
jgi:pectate lyase